jgi:hypothetical protein
LTVTFRRRRREQEVEVLAERPKRGSQNTPALRHEAQSKDRMRPDRPRPDNTRPETAIVRPRARFRTDALSGGIQKWSVERYTRLLDLAAAPPWAWLVTPDYQRVAAFKKPAVNPKTHGVRALKPGLILREILVKRFT